jgi:hypothetical protein
MRQLSRIAVALVALLALAIPIDAQAQATIGQLAPPNPPGQFSGSSDIWQKAVAGDPGYVVPSAGLITSWSTNAGKEPGQLLGFKLLRPLAGERFLVVGHDDPKPLTPSVLNTFKVDIPAQAGDILALNVKNGAMVQSAALFVTGNTADVYSGMTGDAPDGATLSEQESDSPDRLNVTAAFLPAPLISTVNPGSGSVKGGFAVAIRGANFAEVKSVSFGGVPAASFKVDAESQITAVAPASQSVSQAPLVVTTVAGSTAGTFIYEGCRVPKLSGLRLKAAKKKLQRANCRIGKVKTLGVGSPKRARVQRQNPKPGRVLAPGAKVNLTVFRISVAG